MYPRQKQKVQQHIQQIIDFTNPFPMTSRLATKIYRAYGKDSIKRIQQNPYALSRDVFGIGEQTATEIAQILEDKLGKTFSPDIPTRSTTAKRHYCGPGNGKLSPKNLDNLKQKLQYSPRQALPTTWQLNNPDFWTVPDLKRAVSRWYDVSWAHDSSYRNVFKKCGFTYDRQQRIFVPVSLAN